MKKTIIPIFILCMFICLSLTVGAASLSPAFSVIRAQTPMVKTAVGKNSVAFYSEDFQKALGCDTFDIHIVSLPPESAGKMMLGGGEVNVGDTVTADEVSAMRFVHFGEDSAIFEFSSDDEVYTCALRVLSALDFPPVAEDCTAAAIENVTLCGTLSGSDPEGDGVVYQIKKNASHGRLSLDRETGEFMYYPDANYAGKDKFTYTVRDGSGNVSETATVSINVGKNRHGIVYTDMLDSKAYTAAVSVGEKGILVGEVIGGQRFFHPEKTVSRGEFLAMAMNAAGIAPCKTGNTSFCDDEKIDSALRPYVCTAKELGIIFGVETENGIAFKGDEPINASQAATIISRIESLDENATPGASVTTSAGLAENYASADIITRADAANMMYAMIK